jgi:glutathione peroxidase-family protein
MLSECSDACRRLAEIQAEQADRLSAVTSFFDLKGTDIDGNIVDFSKFRNQITIITNVASYCGYTDSHYRGLVQLWSQVKDMDVTILAFPCNQFGAQEPGSNAEIKAFVAKKGVTFTMMDKVNVNGPNTSLIFLYLKHKTNHAAITWNFATYFVVDGQGNVEAHDGVEPMQLKDTIMNLVAKEEL